MAASEITAPSGDTALYSRATDNDEDLSQSQIHRGSAVARHCNRSGVGFHAIRALTQALLEFELQHFFGRRRMERNPSPDDRIEPGDFLIAMGEPQQIRELERKGANV